MVKKNQIKSCIESISKLSSDQVCMEKERCACTLITTRQPTKLKWVALAFTVLHTQPEKKKTVSLWLLLQLLRSD